MAKGRSIGELEEDPGGVVVCPLRIHDSIIRGGVKFAV